MDSDNIIPNRQVIEKAHTVADQSLARFVPVLAVTEISNRFHQETP
jgi:hypothetical protein